MFFYLDLAAFLPQNSVRLNQPINFRFLECVARPDLYKRDLPPIARGKGVWAKVNATFA